MSTVFHPAGSDVELVVHDHGGGMPVFLQHGLGGGEAQVAQVFPDGGHWRRITTECRGHGASTLGTARPFSIAMLAGDIIAVADQLGIDRFVAGGISMGAAIALHLSKACPERVAGLILVRPAWAFEPAPENMRPIREVAELIKSHPLHEARTIFEQSETAARLRVEAPDNLASLLSYFDRTDISAFANVLADMAADRTGVSEDDAARFNVPALVIGNRQDAVHPMATAEHLANAIPGARFVEAPAKATDAAAHFASARTAIHHFLTTQFNHRSLAAS
ncbi:alpha/beta fold hydrolase [Rhizobium sp. TH2]|uniref:alpha/beta fold hydrolase n=1 Tax=Rhizobium sp. TH2 TaxID=2775403 RepID=UPI002157769F|nr:alpha/beta hydrolase [Rhizobium sp. TH2]UVC08590.1 alpha/beta fold hydrolase [Rhizobium sp. TH2]